MHHIGLFGIYIFILKLKNWAIWIAFSFFFDLDKETILKVFTTLNILLLTVSALDCSQIK